MSYAITHFSIGVIGAILLLFATQTHAHNNSPIVLFLGGFLSMAPDALHFISFFQTGPETTLIHDSIVVNVLFGHHAMDTIIDPTNSLSISVIATILMAVTLCVYVYFHIKDRDYVKPSPNHIKPLTGDSGRKYILFVGDANSSRIVFDYAIEEDGRLQLYQMDGEGGTNVGACDSNIETDIGLSKDEFIQ